MLGFFKLGKNDKREKEKEESPVVKEIIDRLSTMGSTTVKEIMVPRIDVITFSLKSSFKDIIDVIKEEGHSRFPVWDKSVDDIIGVLYVKDLFTFFFQKKPELELKSILRPPYFIPETKKVLSLLKELKESKNHIAIVVDEYGGVSGIVALEDVLEEIVGEIQDEYDEEEELIIEISKNNYLLDSRTYLEDINISLKVFLPIKEADTIGGLIFNLFGRIPEQGEKIVYNNLEFEVDSIDGNRINKIKMAILPNNENILTNNNKIT